MYNRGWKEVETDAKWALGETNTVMYEEQK